MRIRRIMAIVMMHSEEFTDKAEIGEILLWWLCDVIFLGFLGRSLDVLSSNTVFGTLMIISMIALCPTVVRPGVAMAKMIADELSAHMLTSTFSTPISQFEWLAASALIAILQALFRLLLGFTIVFVLFGISPFDIGWAFFIILPFFIISGLIIGLWTSAAVYLLGKQCITSLLAINFTFTALCGVFGPITTLPPLLQHVSWCLPATYLVTGLREHVLNNVSLWPFLLKNIVLNIVYALIGTLMLYRMIGYVKQRGLAYLENK